LKYYRNRLSILRGSGSLNIIYSGLRVVKPPYIPPEAERRKPPLVICCVCFRW